MNPLLVDFGRAIVEIDRGIGCLGSAMYYIVNSYTGSGVAYGTANINSFAGVAYAQENSLNSFMSEANKDKKDIEEKLEALIPERGRLITEKGTVEYALRCMGG